MQAAGCAGEEDSVRPSGQPLFVIAGCRQCRELGLSVRRSKEKGWGGYRVGFGLCRLIYDLVRESVSIP